MHAMPAAPIEQALHSINTRDAANEAAIAAHARAGRKPPPALLDTRRRLEAERQRLAAWH